MSDERGPLFSYSISGAGRNDFATAHFCLYEEVEPGVFQITSKLDGKVQLDGGQYDAAEWIREVLQGFLEAL